MKYTKTKNKIQIDDLNEFDIRQILDCGQIFRYEIFDTKMPDKKAKNISLNKNEIGMNNYVEIDDAKNLNHNYNAIVVSKNNFAFIKTYDNKAIIDCNDEDYFENFFDLKTDYASIKNELKKDNFLRPCCEYGYGIRILKQDLFEMIVSFIISANNNIGRIKKSLNFLANKFGEKIEINFNIPKEILEQSDLIVQENGKIFYYAFPTLSALKKLSVQDFVDAGLGYRAEQMFKTMQYLTSEKVDKFSTLSLDEKSEFLLSLCGVGEKVKNCIMLFADGDMTSFPVDTWINKVYNALTKTNTTNRELIRKDLVGRYKNLSGYAQQYFFYYYRENKLR